MIALSVPDAAYAYNAAVERGAIGVREPWEQTDEHGTVKHGRRSQAYGETLHTFVERGAYERPVPPRLRGARGRHARQPGCSPSTTSSATSSSAT